MTLLELLDKYSVVEIKDNEGKVWLLERLVEDIDGVSKWRCSPPYPFAKFFLELMNKEIAKYILTRLWHKKPFYYRVWQRLED